MRFLALLLVILAFPVHILAQEKSKKFFPYDYATDQFPNGLKLITVPTDRPNLIALYIVVRTGSRNEIEPGKSGYAHLFEHMMFRGSEHFSPEERDAILKKAGAESNAYTSDDRTVYHELFAKEDLDKIMELEADRFKGLKYAPDVYKTETRAVLGEFNKNSSNPVEKLTEVLRETAFEKHTYRHTTMGFLRDVEDMPNQYDYSLEFYRRYYRPEYTTILVVGDVTRDRAFGLTKKLFSDWKKGNYATAIPEEPPANAPKSAHVDWPSPTLPYLVVAYHGSAYSDVKKDKAALDFLPQVAFGEDSELYQKLVLKEQKVDVLSSNFDLQADPELFAVYARVKEVKDMDYVRDQILATFGRYTKELIPNDKLAATRSRLRYGTAMSWDSSSSIAGFLAPFIALTGSPDTIEKYFTLYDQITAEDVRSKAAQYFKNPIIVTLSSKSAPKEEGK